MTSTSTPDISRPSECRRCGNTDGHQDVLGRPHSCPANPRSRASFDRIIAFEQGELDEDEVIDLFQDLVDSGLAWQLQGHYGRTAHRLIEAGYITAPKEAQHVRR